MTNIIDLSFIKNNKKMIKKLKQISNMKEHKDKEKPLKCLNTLKTTNSFKISTLKTKV